MSETHLHVESSPMIFKPVARPGFPVCLDIRVSVDHEGLAWATDNHDGPGRHFGCFMHASVAADAVRSSIRASIAKTGVQTNG